VFEFNKMSTVATTILSSFEAAGEKEEENYCKLLLFVEWTLLCDAYEKFTDILEKCRERQRERERERERVKERERNIQMIRARMCAK